MKIERHNYEEYIIDYLEGKLNPDDFQNMQRFLINNPDLAEEVESLMQMDLTAKNSCYPNKGLLYKNFGLIGDINEKNFEELCIAFHEGDLDDSLKSKLLNYIKQEKGRQLVFQLYKSIKYIPDNNIKYYNKNNLKKHIIPVYRKYLLYGTAVAASAIIVLMLNLKGDEKIQSRQVTATGFAEKKERIIQNELENSLKNKVVNKTSKFDDQELAAIDTNRNNKSNMIRLAIIKPLKAEILGIPINIDIDSRLQVIASKDFNISESVSKEEILAQNQTQKNKKQSGNIFIKAIKLGVKGISDLTESQIQLSTQTDDEGNLTAIALSAGEFEFARKMSSKSQKN